MRNVNINILDASVIYQSIRDVSKTFYRGKYRLTWLLIAILRKVVNYKEDKYLIYQNVAFM